MNERIVKFRLVTFFDEVPNQVTPQGEPVLVERTASLGEKISLRPIDEKRLDSLGSLYTAEEAKAIEDGTYAGRDAGQLTAARSGRRVAPATVEPADGEHGDLSSMDAEQLAEYITEHELNVEQTVALAGDDEDSINKVLDAENLATENDPRKGVVRSLEAKLNARTSS